MRRVCSVIAALLAAALSATAATLNLTINTSVSGTYRGAADLGAAVFALSPSLQQPITLGTGTGVNQANLLFSDSRTLGPSGGEDLDLAGALVDPFGATLTFASVKVIRICTDTGNTNDVVVGGAATNAFVGPFGTAADKIAVRPGGCFVWVAPKTGAAVTAGTGDLLRIANAGAGSSVAYTVLIVGTGS